MHLKQTPYNVSRLIYKSVSQTINSEEKKALERWLKKGSNNEFYSEIIQSEAIHKKELLYKNSNKDKAFGRIQKKIDQREQSKLFVLKTYKIFKYASILVVFLAVGNLIYKTSFEETNVMENAVEKIKPGYEKATLVLSDGTIVDLEQHKNEMIVSNNLTQVQNTEKGLVYVPSEKSNQKKGVTQPLKYNTLQVPIGGIYTVQLPDGTKVWLNSATSLTYPERFDGEQRIVQLEGEAYFEVTKGAKEFIVQTSRANITVLGTQFNVSSYNTDPYFSSTLVEGKIKLSTSQDLNTNSSVILAPNQRGVVGANTSRIEVNNVDVEVFTAWKEGKFYFEKERLENILTRMSRWYNIDVVFDNESLKTETFTGVFYKNKTIDNLLDMISKTARVNYIITKNKSNNKYELKLTRE